MSSLVMVGMLWFLCVTIVYYVIKLKRATHERFLESEQKIAELELRCESLRTQMRKRGK